MVEERREPRTGWLSMITRMAGSAFVLTAPLVTLQSELDSKAIQQRLDRIEDPISALHPEVRSVSKELYRAVAAADSKHVNMPADFYEVNRRVLAVLESHGLIRGGHTISQRFAAGLWVINPQYLLYMAALAEDPYAMDELLRRVDAAAPGRWLRGAELAEELGVPSPTVRAVFDLYESRGLGFCSKEVGADNYYVQA